MEHEALIAVDLVLTLEDGGYRVLGPAATVDAALALLEGERPDAAVLDVNIGRRLVTPVAWALHRLEVPFVLASACAWADLPPDPLLRQVPRMGKPTLAARLLAALTALLSRPTRNPPPSQP